MNDKLIYAVYPFLFSVFPLLSFYIGNKAELQFNVLYLPILIALGATAILWFLFRLIFKEIKTVSALTFLASLFFYSYGYYIDKTPLVWGSTIKAVVVYIGIFALIFGLIWRFKNRKELTGFLTVIAVYTTLLSLASIVPYEIQRRTMGSNISDSVGPKLKPVKRSDTPDIYYLIFDRYANATTLKEQYDFDNSDFLNHLESIGFYIADKAFANYPKTHLSLGSSLNLGYFDDFVKTVGIDNGDYTPSFELVQNNKVAKFLKASDYRYYYFGDWWEPTRVNKLADKNINLYAHSGEFARKFLRTTILQPIVGDYYKGSQLFGFFEDRIFENINYKFDKLDKIASEKSPKFIFAHMLFPHYPYLFDANCKRVDDQRPGNDDEKYIEQTKCANTKIKKMLDSILSKSKTPPIIIFQSDEGPFKVDEMNRDGDRGSWTKVSSAAVERHMRILNAYYLPGFNTATLYPSISPVNTFRIIFSHYFDMKLPLFEDKSYFIPDISHPYRYIDITDKVKQ